SERVRRRDLQAAPDRRPAARRAGRRDAGVSGAPGSAPGPGRPVAYALLGAFALYLATVAALLRPAGGLVGRYAFLGPDGLEVFVHERVDRTIDFPVSQRLDAAYIFNWDLGRFGYPASMPAYVIRWTGFLQVPKRGVYGFSADAQGEVTLVLDGAPLDVHAD